MKNPSLLILLLFLCTVLNFAFNKSEEHNEPAQLKERSYVTEIDASEKSIAFSRIAKPGKISVFIMSAHWCAPCKALKTSFEEAFKSNAFKLEDVEVYYCLLTKGNDDSLDKLDKNPAYRNFKYVDQLTSVYPTTYILAPTTNCYAIVKGNKTQEIMGYISDLVNVKRQYFDIKALDYSIDNDGNNKVDNEIQELKKQVEELRTVIENNQKENRNSAPNLHKVDALKCELSENKLRVSFHLNQVININMVKVPSVRITDNKSIVFSDDELNSDFRKQLNEFCKGNILIQTIPKETTIMVYNYRIDNQKPVLLFNSDENKITYEFKIL